MASAMPGLSRFPPPPGERLQDAVADVVESSSCCWTRSRSEPGRPQRRHGIEPRLLHDAGYAVCRGRLGAARAAVVSAVLTPGLGEVLVQPACSSDRDGCRQSISSSRVLAGVEPAGSPRTTSFMSDLPSADRLRARCRWASWQSAPPACRPGSRHRRRSASADSRRRTAACRWTPICWMILATAPCGGASKGCVVRRK